MTIKVEPTKESVLCPECGSLCYWTVYYPRELNCCKCGYMVDEEDGSENRIEVNENQRVKVRENMNG